MQVQSLLQASKYRNTETGDPRGFNKGCSLKFHEGSQVQQTPEEGRRTYWPKRFGNNKDEDNTPKTLNDKNVTVLASIWKVFVYHMFMLSSFIQRQLCII